MYIQYNWRRMGGWLGSLSTRMCQCFVLMCWDWMESATCWERNWSLSVQLLFAWDTWNVFVSFVKRLFYYILYLFLCSFEWLLGAIVPCFNQRTMHERTVCCTVDFCICWTNKLTPGKTSSLSFAHLHSQTLILRLLFVFPFMETICSVHSVLWHYLTHSQNPWVTA